MLYTQWGPFCALVLTQIYIWTDSWLSSASNQCPGIVSLKSWNAVWLCGYSRFHIWGIIGPLFSSAGKMVQWVKCLLVKPRNLKCGPQKVLKIWEQQLVPVILGFYVMGKGRGDKRVGRSLWRLAGYVQQWVTRDSDPNKVGGWEMAQVVVLWPPHTYCGTYVPTCMNIYKHRLHTYNIYSHHTHIIYAFAAHTS